MIYFASTGVRPGPVTSPLTATRHSLRALARRWRDLHEEITAHEALLEQLVRDTAPQLVEAFGIGPDTAAEMLVVAGNNPDRVRSETAWATLCGVAPIPASSGMTVRHRRNRGGHRQANAAIYRTVIVRMQHHDATRAYVARRTVNGRTKPEIMLSEALRRPRDLGTAQAPAPTTFLGHNGWLTVIGASTRWPRASSPPCRSNSSTDGAGRLVKSRPMRSSNGSKFYNPVRRHSGLDYLSPVDYERAHTPASSAA